MNLQDPLILLNDSSTRLRAVSSFDILKIINNKIDDETLYRTKHGRAKRQNSSNSISRF